MEILRHRPDMSHAGFLVVVAPLANRHRRNAFEDRIGIHPRDVVLGISVTDRAALATRSWAGCRVWELDGESATAHETSAARQRPRARSALRHAVRRATVGIARRTAKVVLLAAG